MLSGWPTELKDRKSTAWKKENQESNAVIKENEIR